MRPALVSIGIALLIGCGPTAAPTPPLSTPATPTTPVMTPPAAVVVSETSPIATLLGKPVLARDCLSSANGIGSIEVGISNLILSVLMDEFCQSDQMTLPQEEIDSFWKTMLAGAQRANLDPAKPFPEPKFDELATQTKLQETRAKLAALDLPWRERITLEGRERGLHLLLEHKLIPTATA